MSETSESTTTPALDGQSPPVVQPPWHRLQKSSEEATADHIKDLTTSLVHSMNDGTFATLACKVMIAEYSGQHLMDDTPWIVSNVPELLQLMTEFLDANPHFHGQIVDMNVRVDEQLGTASAWLRRIDTGLTDKPQLETMMELMWVKVGEEWMCSGYQGVRSFPLFGGVRGEGAGGL